MQKKLHIKLFGVVVSQYTLDKSLKSKDYISSQRCPVHTKQSWLLEIVRERCEHLPYLCFFFGKIKRKIINNQDILVINQHFIKV